MDSSLLIEVGAVGIAFLAVEVVFAQRDGDLTPGQMGRKYTSYAVFVPFAAHFGMWSDLLILTPLLAFIVALFAAQWTVTEALSACAGGLMISLLFHWNYAQSSIPDSLTWRGGITRAGYVHVFYTALSLAILGLFFFATRGRSQTMTCAVAITLAVHVTVSGRVFLAVVNRLLLRRNWCPDQFGDWQQWAIVVGCYASIVGVAALPLG